MGLLFAAVPGQGGFLWCFLWLTSYCFSFVATKCLVGRDLGNIVSPPVPTRAQGLLGHCPPALGWGCCEEGLAHASSTRAGRRQGSTRPFEKVSCSAFGTRPFLLGQTCWWTRLFPSALPLGSLAPGSLVSSPRHLLQSWPRADHTPDRCLRSAPLPPVGWDDQQLDHTPWFVARTEEAQARPSALTLCPFSAWSPPPGPPPSPLSHVCALLGG